MQRRLICHFVAKMQIKEFAKLYEVWQRTQAASVRIKNAKPASRFSETLTILRQFKTEGFKLAEVRSLYEI